MSRLEPRQEKTINTSMFAFSQAELILASIPGWILWASTRGKLQTFLLLYMNFITYVCPRKRTPARCP